MCLWARGLWVPLRMVSSSSAEHKAKAAAQGAISIAVVTVSDTRTPEDDVNVAYLREQIEAAGHVLAGYRLIKDEPDQVSAVLDEFAQSEAQIVLFNGGTGISRRDTTFDALSDKLEKTLSGFGEIFRLLSYEEIGAAAMLSRATGGVYKDTVVFSTPGSPAAVRLAWEKLIQPELQHLAWLVA